MDAVLVSTGESKADVDVARFNEAVLLYISDRSSTSVDAAGEGGDDGSSFNAVLIKNALTGLLKSEGWVNLNGTVFPGPFILKGRTIGDISLSFCSFQGELELSNCVFLGDFLCEDSKVKNATFFGSEFRGKVRIDRTEFDGIVRFTDTKIEKRMTIWSSRFRDTVHFCGRPAEDGAGHQLSIQSSRFDQALCLKHRAFTEIALENNDFAVAIEMTGCKVPEGTTFSRSKYRAGSADERRSYAVLRKLASDTGDIRGFERFRALEFACQAKDKTTPRSVRLMTFIYGFGSRYGTDPLRPVALLLLINLLFHPGSRTCRDGPTRPAPGALGIRMVHVRHGARPWLEAAAGRPGGGGVFLPTLVDPVPRGDLPGRADLSVPRPFRAGFVQDVQPRLSIFGKPVAPFRARLRSFPGLGPGHELAEDHEAALETARTVDQIDRVDAAQLRAEHLGHEDVVVVERLGARSRLVDVELAADAIDDRLAIDDLAGVRLGKRDAIHRRARDSAREQLLELHFRRIARRGDGGCGNQARTDDEGLDEASHGTRHSMLRLNLR
jgi:hypothetical protein